MITRFRGEHFYLSNMFPLETYIETNLGLLVPTSEHVYMADRFVDEDIQREVALARGEEDDIRVYKDGLAAKQLAHEYIAAGASQLPEWQIACLGVMHSAILRKFRANAGIRAFLLGTGSELIVEGNTWEDRFWGVDPPGSDNGKNNLGKILMQVREELRLAA